MLEERAYDRRYAPILKVVADGLLEHLGVDMMVAKTAPFAKKAKLEVIATGFGLAEGKDQCVRAQS